MEKAQLSSMLKSNYFHQSNHPPFHNTIPSSPNLAGASGSTTRTTRRPHQHLHTSIPSPRSFQTSRCPYQRLYNVHTSIHQRIHTSQPPQDGIVPKLVAFPTHPFMSTNSSTFHQIAFIQPIIHRHEAFDHQLYRHYELITTTP